MPKSPTRIIGICLDRLCTGLVRSNKWMFWVISSIFLSLFTHFLFIDGTKLVQYPNDKDKFIRTLGFFIDDKLNLKEHFKKVLPRISTSIFFMRRAQGILNQRSLKLIYFSRVHSHLILAASHNSCSGIWFFLTT